MTCENRYYLIVYMSSVLNYSTMASPTAINPVMPFSLGQKVNFPLSSIHTVYDMSIMFSPCFCSGVNTGGVGSYIYEDPNTESQS